MDVDSRVALAASHEFTGTVARVDGAIFTVKFDVGGRGWLRRDALVEIEALPGKDTPMTRDNDDTETKPTSDASTDRREPTEPAKTPENDAHNKSWPPPTMETKAAPA